MEASLVKASDVLFHLIRLADGYSSLVNLTLAMLAAH